MRPLSHDKEEDTPPCTLCNGRSPPFLTASFRICLKSRELALIITKTHTNAILLGSKASFSMCPADNSWPGWITVVVVLSVLCAVFGIGGAILCIYLRNRHRSRLSNGLIVEEPVAASTYGAHR